MLNKKKLLKTREYWVEEIQNEIFRQVKEYMHMHNLNQNDLALKWGVSKGYVSQLLNGNCNFSIKKLVELSLSLGKAPMIKYIFLDKYIAGRDNDIQMDVSKKNSISVNKSVKGNLYNHS